MLSHVCLVANVELPADGFAADFGRGFAGGVGGLFGVDVGHHDRGPGRQQRARVVAAQQCRRRRSESPRGRTDRTASRLD